VVVAESRPAPIPKWKNPYKAPRRPLPRLAGEECRGLAPTACRTRSGCRWVAHVKPRDKNGRKLVDYCRRQ
jgi:hypothetical protein